MDRSSETYGEETLNEASLVERSLKMETHADSVINAGKWYNLLLCFPRLAIGEEKTAIILHMFFRKVLSKNCVNFFH